MDPITREEIIAEMLKTYTQSLNSDNLEDMGMTAEEINERTQFGRNNISKYLNIFVREGRAVKIKSRPVRFFDRKALEEVLGSRIPDSLLEVKSPEELRDLREIDAFSKLIGYDSSLKKQIKMAKSAVLYPPDGLHSLLIGPTGSGKNALAEAMYNFGVQSGRFAPDAPFVIFNCADYSNNTQLLLTQLFGYVRGAFTGADADKNGLVDLADAGMLFLDEVHRLPPEGQEMLFHLLDYGTYRRLGDSQSRAVRILIVGATTEDPESALLQTFNRRFPMVIDLPTLATRGLMDRLAIIKHFFQLEYYKVKIPITLTPEALIWLMLYQVPGNVGQLKNDIQLLCAEAFLNAMVSGSKRMVIDFDTLQDNNISSKFEYQHSKEEVIKLIGWQGLEFPLSSIASFPESSDDISRQMYDGIKTKYQQYKDAGFKKEQIDLLLNSYIKRNFYALINQASPQENRNGLASIVSEKTIKMAEKTLNHAAARLSRTFSRQVFYGFAMHLDVLVERARNHEAISNPQLDSIQATYPQEYAVALEIKAMLEEEYSITLPQDEAGFIAIFLSPGIEGDQVAEVGILVIAHGYATASSMADTANRLMGSTYAHALDMPLNQDVQTTLELAVAKVCEINKGKGVLLMVDMGSLLAFGDIISKRTGIPVRAVGMVSTLMVMEAVRKAAFCTLDKLYEEVASVKPFIAPELKKQVAGTDLSQKPVIVTVCITGYGAAQKLAEYLRDHLPFGYQVEFIPVALDGEGELPEAIRVRRIIACVGTVKPKTSYFPFFSLDEILAAEGMDKLEEAIASSNDHRDIIEFASKVVEQYLHHLEFSTVKTVVHQAILNMEQVLTTKFNKSVVTRLFVHICCTLDRLAEGNIVLECPDKDKIIQGDPKNYALIKQQCTFLCRQLDLEIPDEEICYIYKIIFEE